MTVNQKIEQLRKVMKDKKIDYYIIPSADFHQSEYVGDYFKARQYITGFTGSAGTALITKEKSMLWTDGRYFLQAEIELKDSEVELMKMGEKNIPTIIEYIQSQIKSNENIGFDGRVIPVSEGLSFKNILPKNSNVLFKEDLLEKIWQDRPELSKEKVFELDIKYCGLDSKSKIEQVRKVMDQKNASHHILTTLDDICWLLNIRGNDVKYSHLVLSYIILTFDKVKLYVDETKLPDTLKSKLKANQVEILEYNKIYEDVKSLSSDDAVLLDKDKINYLLFNNINSDVKIIDTPNPSTLLKSMKNKVEIENLRKAQLMDAIAHVKFIKWLKENVDKIEITEISASDKLDEFRKQNASYLEPSFSPISAFADNGAIIHYSADNSKPVVLKSGYMYMTDTGGGYYEGTTDITRTYALGEVSSQIKEHFTVVAMANLSLSSARFMYGISGSNLDILARKPFWDRGLNYNHGTGHGVGYLLNVHEGPINFRWQKMRDSLQPLEEGMVITDEPGIYIAGSHGIRLENELLVVRDIQNEYGDFMKFEIMTHIPFDLDAIEPSIMSDEDKKRLNDYHKSVYELLAPHLDEDERVWLEKYTRTI